VPLTPADEKRKTEVLDGFKSKKQRYIDYWDPIYKETEKHRKFTLLGKQMDDAETRRYGLKNPLMPNLLLTYANHEANKTLQIDYQGKVSPNGGGADDVKARERQDVLRGLQRTNKITEIFNQVRRLQVCGGIGYSMAKLDYAGKRGFGKTLKDEFIEDYRNVFPDPLVKSPTLSDMRDFIIRQQIPKSEWKQETGRDPDDESWGGRNTKTLWHYWVREDVKDAEYLMDSGETQMGSKMDLSEDEGEEKEPDLTGVSMDESGQPLMRPTEDYTWCWYKINEEADDIWDEEKWLGSYPPLVAATGRKVTDGGGNQETPEKVYYQPITQFAEEPQKVYTLLENIIALRLSRSPYSKWKVAFESMDIKQAIKLRRASEVGDDDILYKAFDSNGNAIPAPEEIEPHVLDQVLITLQEAQHVKIQRIFGIYDANLGARSNEQSGVAIEQRAKGGELSNYDSQFNFMAYVEQVIRVKLDLIPKYLKAPQQIAFVDPDDQVVMQWINTTGGKQFSPDEEYALSIDALPISKTSREEEAAALTNMAKMIPMLAQNPRTAALIVKAQPGASSAKIAEILAGEDPQTQQQKQEMQKAQEQIQQLQGKLQQATAQQQQAAQTIGGLKNALTGMKQTVGMLKQQHTIETQTAEMQATHEAIGKQMEDMGAELDRQIEQYNAETARISADANMLKAVGALAKPDPVTPQLGQGLP
jgi:hypothetical protein